MNNSEVRGKIKVWGFGVISAKCFYVCFVSEIQAFVSEIQAFERPLE